MRDRIFLNIPIYNLLHSRTDLRDDIVAIRNQITFKRKRQINSCIFVLLRQNHLVFMRKKIVWLAIAING